MSQLQQTRGALNVFLWFIGTSVLTIWFVFRDPGFDYRFLLVGVLAPDVIDGSWGGARAFHSIAASIAMLFLVMVLTIGRRSTRKRWLAVPIGLFLHLIFDGAFADTGAFWWPATGMSFRNRALPAVERGWLNFALEVIGLALCVVIFRLFGLAKVDRRREFLSRGRLNP